MLYAESGDIFRFAMLRRRGPVELFQVQRTQLVVLQLKELPEQEVWGLTSSK